MNQKTKKLIILNIPYVVIGLFCSNIGEAWRIAAGTDISTKLPAHFCIGALVVYPPSPPTIEHSREWAVKGA